MKQDSEHRSSRKVVLRSFCTEGAPGLVASAAVILAGALVGLAVQYWPAS